MVLIVIKVFILFYIKINVIYSQNNIHSQEWDQYFCGQIAKPPGVEIVINNTTVDTNIRFKDNSKVYYKCKERENLLIGNNVRQCVRGYWTGSVPRCGNYFTLFCNYLSKVTKNKIYIQSKQLFKPIISDVP